MKLDKKSMLRIFLIAAGCIVVYWLLCEMEKVSVILGGIGKVVSPFVTGAIIAFILNVPMRAYENMLHRIKRAKFRRLIAVVLTIISVLLILTVICLLLVPQLVRAIAELLDSISDLPDWLENTRKKFVEKYPELQGVVSNGMEGMIPNTGDVLSKVFDGVVNFLSSAASGIVNAFLAVVFAIYCLFNKDTLARQGRKILYAYFPEKFADRAIRVLRLSNVTFSNFLSGQCVEACILGCLFAVVMAIFDMPFIPLICVLIAVSAFIPIVGAVFGCLIGAFLIATSGEPMKAVYFVVISFVIQQIENNLIYPRVVGTSIGLPGMWVLVAVSVGGSLMGVGGMFIMIPLASVFYALFRMYTLKKLKCANIDEEKLKPRPIDMSKSKHLDNPDNQKQFIDEL